MYQLYGIYLQQVELLFISLINSRLTRKYPYDTTHSQDSVARYKMEIPVKLLSKENLSLYEINNDK